MHSFENIQRKAEQLLSKCYIQQPHVDLDTISEFLNLKLQPSILDDDTSGMLVVKEGKGVIGFNHAHREVRKRFTVAHEIGHYILHYKQEHKNEDLFVDKSISVYFRGQQTNKEEKEANAFAANLLMPERMVRGSFEDFKYIGEYEIEKVAKTFKVSSIAMSWRLQNLNIISGF